METVHEIHVGDSRSLSELADDSVQLVVTSPPYPMIELWDEQFAAFDPQIEDALAEGRGRDAFEGMHALLDAVWTEVERVLVDGGIACINVGDATRTLDDSFRVYQNHARIVEAFEERGFDPLPEILWRKPANSAAKFMGSGMVPPNAYVTLEHEYLLVFRNGGTRRSFEPGDEKRYASAYFWEERNRWFSDVWTDLRGELQTLDDDDRRERTAAYPVELPIRLINMYSVYGDTVLDPFWGTGTTTIAAMLAGRNSVGKEYESGFRSAFAERVAEVAADSRTVAARRLCAHEQFVEQRRAAGDLPSYEAEHYDVPVVTKQERSIRLYTAPDIEAVPDEHAYRVAHEPVRRIDAVADAIDSADVTPL
jgi:DNA modification methylase